MINLNSVLGMVNKEVAKGTDQSIVKAAPSKLLPAGEYAMYLTEYVETGLHKVMFQGKDTGKPAQMHVRIGFAIIDESGYVYNLRLTEMPISAMENSTFSRVFKAMQAGDNTMKHIAQRLGKTFYARVDEYVVKSSGNIINVIDKYSFKPVPKFDPQTGKAMALAPLNQEQQDKLIKLFLWTNPTQECWDSLYIEKNNFIQNRCMASLDYSESALACMTTKVMMEEAESSVFDDSPEQY